MRYYRIVVSDKSGKVVVPRGFEGLLGGATYTSYVKGQTLPGAWNVEFDIPVGPASSPMGGALVRVWGISLAEISQATDLVNKKVAVYGGMQKGLPLANPQQAGLLVQGFVFQAFGNWINTDMTLDLVIQPGDEPLGTGAVDRPINLVLDWKKGTPLAQALRNALLTAFPGFKQTVSISSQLVFQNDVVGSFSTLTQLGQWAKQMSKSVIKDAGYNGVEIAIGQNSVSVYDGSERRSAAKAIAFTDLIGQPTWIEAPSIQLKCVMRADLQVGDLITLPQSAVINTAQAQSSLVPNQRLTFQGEFMIQQIRHLGNYRQADAASWVTVINAAPTQLGGNG